MPMTPAEFKQARMALGLSAEQLAQCLELYGARSVYKYERGESPVLRPLALLMSFALTDAKVRKALLEPLAPPPQPASKPSRSRPSSRSRDGAPESADTPV